MKLETNNSRDQSSSANSQLSHSKTKQFSRANSIISNQPKFRREQTLQGKDGMEETFGSGAKLGKEKGKKKLKKTSTVSSLGHQIF